MSELFTRQRIVEVATEYFLKHGFSRVTTDELAEELGMSKKTLYKHFASKEELLRECVQMVMHEFSVKTATIVHDTGLSFIDKLQRLVQMLAAQHARIGKTVLDDMRRNAPQIWKEINEWRSHNILTEFRKFIREGMESGVFRSDIPDILVVTIYLAVVQNVMVPERLNELPFSMQEVYEAIAKIHYEGLLTEEGRRLFHERGAHSTPFTIA